MTVPPDDPSLAEREHEEEREASEGLGVASLIVGTIGLIVGLLTIFGLRGVALSLGSVAMVLAGVAWRRATTKGQLGTAYGGFALGVVATAVGFYVAGSG